MNNFALTRDTVTAKGEKEKKLDSKMFSQHDKKMLICRENIQ